MKIGILQTGHVPESLSEEFGQYPGMFAKLLEGHGFTFESWRVVDGEFPESPAAADGWLITGSRHGAYDKLDWIAPLEELVRAIHASGRPLVGICFGHQIVAQALGGRVEKYSGGWAIGAQTYHFPDGDMTITAWHQDQVTRPPEEAEVVASSDFCRYAALLYGDRAYTVQPHPEFEDSFTRGLIDNRGRGVVPDEQLEAARDKLGTPLDRERMAAQFAKFFRERRIA